MMLWRVSITTPSMSNNTARKASIETSPFRTIYGFLEFYLSNIEASGISLVSEYGKS
jgi:hypothetical protein